LALQLGLSLHTSWLKHCFRGLLSVLGQTWPRLASNENKEDDKETSTGNPKSSFGFWGLRATRLFAGNQPNRCT